MASTGMLSATSVFAFAGVLALTYPDQAANLANQFKTWAGLEAPPEKSQVHLPSRQFDAIVRELVALDEIPRPTVERAPIAPHNMVAAKADQPSTWKQQIASARVRTSPTQSGSFVTQPDGIYARSRIGGIRGGRSSGRSLFEQSRFYRNNGSAFDRMHSSRRRHLR